MARELGLKNATTYQNWEHKTDPGLEMIKKIAAILQIPAYTLLQGIIDFTDKKNTAAQPDPIIEIRMHLSELNKLKFSLSELGSVFSRASDSGKGIQPGIADVSLADKRKPRQSAKKKV